MTVRELYGRYERVIIGTAAVVVFLLLWQATITVRPNLLQFISSPAACVAAGGRMVLESSFWHDLAVSGLELLIGFVMAVGVGLLLGLGMGVNKRMACLFEPLVMAMNSTPRMALIPILIVWFGIGAASKIAVVFLGAVIPVTVNTMVGIQSVSPVLLRAAQSFCAGKRDIYFKVVFPSSLPSIMAGVRLGLGRGILGVIIAEMYVAVAGVGHALIVYGQAFRVNPLIFLTALVSLLGLALVGGMGHLEKRMSYWRL